MYFHHFPKAGRNCAVPQEAVCLGGVHRAMGVCKVLSFALALLCLPLLRVSGGKAFFYGNEMDALQSLWAAWNNTPNANVNLAGWHSSASNQSLYPCFNENDTWQGVTCLRHQRNDSNSDTWIIGLTLSDASISGILPPEIQNLNNLVILTLTGNANLSGFLPKELGQLLSLNTLDLHDNNFNGIIPKELSTISYLQQLDLSGNQFVDQFPMQFSDTGTLQVYRLSRNRLFGDIPQDAFQNLTQLVTLDLSGNTFTGSPPDFTMMHNINSLDLSSNNFTGPPNLTMIQTLQHVNLSRSFTPGAAEFSTMLTNNLPESVIVLDASGNGFNGPLPDWSSPKVRSLQKLYLDRNNITGILNITRMFMLNLIPHRSKTGNSNGNLQLLSLKNNSITGVVFDPSFITDVLTVFNLQGNPYCPDDPTALDEFKRCYCTLICLPIAQKVEEDRKVMAITITVSACILIVVIILGVILMRRRESNMRYLLSKFNESDVNPRRFQYSDLRAATNNFNNDTKLGAGAYGAVYKGVLSNKTVVAVKQLFMKSQEGINEFLNEVVLVTNLQHRNLVTLKGYCLHGKEMLLVYEYVDNYDLDKILLGSKSKDDQVIIWPSRLKICLGVAQGLYYLHASAEPKIIHRDIKASNVLLDKNLNPKIADFGLARPFPEEKSQIMTEQRAGTRGYFAPEYMFWGQLSDKADVYSFGVLVLEVLSGRRNVDRDMPEDDVYLPHYAWRLHREGKLRDLVDPRLDIHIDEEVEVQRVLQTALLCVQTAVDRRPTMFRVVAMLLGDSEVGPIAADASNSGLGDPLGFQGRGLTDDSSVFSRAATGNSGESSPLPLFRRQSSGPRRSSNTKGKTSVELSELMDAR